MQEIIVTPNKDYTIKIVNKIMGDEPHVIGKFTNIATGKIIDVKGSTKEEVLNKCKKLINKDTKLSEIKFK